jgi:hypothetical protein
MRLKWFVIGLDFLVYPTLKRFEMVNGNDCYKEKRWSAFEWFLWMWDDVNRLENVFCMRSVDCIIIRLETQVLADEWNGVVDWRFDICCCYWDYHWIRNTCVLCCFRGFVIRLDFWVDPTALKRSIVTKSDYWCINWFCDWELFAGLLWH